MRHWIVLACLVILAGCILAGCSNKTETGYEPRRLGDSDGVQRGYYAAPFSPAAREAAAERKEDFSSRRPTDWRP